MNGAARPPVLRLLAVSPTGLRSGAEVVLRDYLRAALEAGWSVHCLRPHGAFDQELAAVGVDGAGIPEQKLPAGPRPVAALGLARSVLRAARTIRRAARAADLVVVNGPFALPAIRVARLRTPVVMVVHDVVVRPGLARAIRLNRRVVARAVAVSEAAAVHPRSLGIPTTVVPNGVLVPETPAEPPDPSATPIVGITAAITPWKGHRVFLRAVAAVPGVEAEVMGGAFPKDQGYERELHELAADLGIADRVRFLGHVAEPAPVLRRWQVAVSASTDPEAGPLSVLEAMAHGIPVVASDHGGAQEILRGNDAGILVPVNDPDALAAAVRDVLADDERRRRMGVAGRSTVLARHRADQAAAAFLAVLGEAAADPPRPGRGR